MDKMTPLICGGRNPDRNQCYKLESGAWQPMPAMIQIRYHFAGIPFSPFQNLTHKFFVLGFFNANSLFNLSYKHSIKD